MKILSIFSVIALCAVTLFSACGSDGDAARDAALDNAGGAAVPTAPIPGAPGTTPPATPEPPQNAAGVWHYTCPSGCAGGGGAAAPCPKCGSTLAHNQAYHAGDQTAPPPPTPSAVPEGLTPIPNPSQAATPEPAQNAKGVWHYTCAKGCAGGAGSATACAKCGGTLAHNQSYHQ